MKKIFIGKRLYTKQKFFHKSNKNLIMEVPTRRGFSSAILIPTLLENRGNILIIGDVKGEAYYLTESYRKEIGHKILKVDKNTLIEEIESILSEKNFTIYVEICFAFFMDESSLLYTELLKKLLEKIKEKNIDCLTIINEFPAFFYNHQYLLDYICDNNKFLLRIHTLSQLDRLEYTTNKKIKIEDFDTIKIDFYSPKLIKFNDKKYIKNHYFENKNYLKMLDIK